MTLVPDCFLFILSDIDGSLASLLARSRSFVNKTITFVAVLYQTFAFLRTCFLYYNLCLCKSFKERAPQESASKVGHPIREAASPHLRVQRYAFSANWQNISRFFSKKGAFLPSIHYILYMRATVKERKRQSPEQKVTAVYAVAKGSSCWFRRTEAKRR